MVGAVGVVLGWVAWEVILGEVLVTWLFITFLRGSVPHLRGSASTRSGHVFLDSSCIWHPHFDLLSQKEYQFKKKTVPYLVKHN